MRSTVVNVARVALCVALAWLLVARAPSRHQIAHDVQERAYSPHARVVAEPWSIPLVEREAFAQVPGVNDCAGGKAPQITSASDVSTSGGTVSITGAGFDTLCNGGNCRIGFSTVVNGIAYYIPATGSGLTSTTAMGTVPAIPCASPGSDGACHYNLRVSQGPCSDSAEMRDVLHIVTTIDPSVQYGANLGPWYREDTGLSSVGWNDKNAATACNLTGTATFNPVANASFNAVAQRHSVTFDGVSQSFSDASCTLNGGSPITSGALFVVFRPTSLTSNNGAPWIQINSVSTQARLGPALTFPSGYMVSTGGVNAAVAMGTAAGLQADLTWNSTNTGVGAYNSTPAIGTGSPTVTVTNVSMGGFSSFFAPSEIVEAWVVVNYTPNSADLLTSAKYVNERYFDYAPSNPTLTTPMSTSGTGFRAEMTGLIPGATANFSGGVSNVCSGMSVSSVDSLFTTNGTFHTTGSPTGTGSCFLTIVNPDGGSRSAPNAVTVTNAPDPFTCTNDLSTTGKYVVGSTYNTTSGGKMVTLHDLSGLGNNEHQGTSADQGVINSPDPNWNGASSITYDGVAVNYSSTGGSAGNIFCWTGTCSTSISAIDAFNTQRYTASAVTSIFAATENTISPNLQIQRYNGSNEPQTFFGGAVATWGASTRNVSTSVLSDVPFAANPTISVNVGTGGVMGSAVTASQTASAASATAVPVVMGSSFGGSNFFAGSSSCSAFFNRSLTGSEPTCVLNWMESTACGAP